MLFDRSGAGPVFIPAASLTGVRQESGMAGKFVEKDGLLVLSWTLGSRELDTGFRTRHADGQNRPPQRPARFDPRGPSGQCR